MYIFTDKKGKTIEIMEFTATETQYPGDRALAYRKKLEKKLGKIIVAWAHMGKDNPKI